ncbi:pentapeptide repeat-containing protein [Micromonospora sp. NPDC051141]|uniref:pentapeptide repeat-containing protein n=1 Tax=Micromonospora sp. NPDC051141 TaxID=3364284 RepID=UPI0037BAF631
MNRALIRVGVAILTIGAGIAAIAALSFLLGPVANRATPTDKDRAAAVNSTRQTLLAAAGGSAALVGLAFTARTYYLARRGQITDRYVKAIGLLASERINERLGGIYALEHLMQESAREHSSVVDVLAAFIRHSAPIQPKSMEFVSSDGPSISPSIDVQAALTVLGRRPKRREQQGPQLNDCDLSGANLKGADLRSANLRRTQLRGAFLAAANLDKAELWGADLRDALLFATSLRGANLGGDDEGKYPPPKGLGPVDFIINFTDASTRMAKSWRDELREVHEEIRKAGPRFFELEE